MIDTEEGIAVLVLPLTNEEEITEDVAAKETSTETDITNKEKDMTRITNQSKIILFNE